MLIQYWYKLDIEETIIANVNKIEIAVLCILSCRFLTLKLKIIIIMLYFIEMKG